ncbi:MAG: 1-acyl-sn-glycerol-3-phosphate acyltransferase [Desulfobacterales bacterium]|nr:1-acyl-sn-glycerol-3-phosphate acyltransferase [Desulfobacterales bacterium]
MNLKDKVLFNIQYVLGRLFIFLTAPAVSLFVRLAGYKIKDLNNIRAQIKTMFKEHPGPWIICANHLTLIDSLILAYAMFPIHRYLVNYRLVPWNVPEKYNYFHKNIIVALFCYLVKCIPIIRKGSRAAVKSSLNRCAHVLAKGESLMIFPEGTRSRTGRVDVNNFPYGVGRLVCNYPESLVLCVYLRGEHQITYGKIPKINERFAMIVDCIRPTSSAKGLKAQRDCSRQVIEKLAEMERHYFELCW